MIHEKHQMAMRQPHEVMMMTGDAKNRANIVSAVNMHPIHPLRYGSMPDIKDFFKCTISSEVFSPPTHLRSRRTHHLRWSTRVSLPTSLSPRPTSTLSSQEARKERTSWIWRRIQFFLNLGIIILYIRNEIWWISTKIRDTYKSN